MFQIRKNVPLPAPARGPGRAPIYPFAEMQIGDSFVVTIEEGDTAEKVSERVRAAASTWVKRNMSTIRFAVRATVENGQQVVGVWAEPAKPSKPRAPKAAPAPTAEAAAAEAAAA